MMEGKNTKWTRVRKPGGTCALAFTFVSLLSPLWIELNGHTSCNAFSTPNFRWPVHQDSSAVAEARKVVLEKAAEASGGFYPPSSASLFSEMNTVLVSTKDPIYATRAARMAKMAGDIYESILEEEMYELGETFVANGTSSNVAWVVTDSIDTSGTVDQPRTPILVRTITIRGYHAADNKVDRLGLLNQLVTATPTSVKEGLGIEVHGGLWEIAQDLYKDLSPFLKGLSKSHKLIFNGHSIGGSLAILFLMQARLHLGVDFVKSKLLHVYTFGSPPVCQLVADPKVQEDAEAAHCGILERLGLPLDLVKGYTQPWDPIARIYSSIDPLYPLVDDIDVDGVTVWKTGPPRTLRPLVKKLLESWEDWPQTRDERVVTLKQSYTHVGIQHILLPDPIRYMTDRLMSVNIAVPPTDSIIQFQKAGDLLPALHRVFPLDTFSISTVPVAVRSFVHHFYPAYSMSFAGFVSKKHKSQHYSPEDEADIVSKATMLPDAVVPDDLKEMVEKGANNLFQMDWAEVAAGWVLGGGKSQQLRK